MARDDTLTVTAPLSDRGTGDQRRGKGGEERIAAVVDDLIIPDEYPTNSGEKPR